MLGRDRRIESEVDSSGAANGNQGRQDFVPRLPEVLVLAAWWGLAAGLLELLLLVLRVQVFEKGFFLRSPHFVWMIPVSDVLIYVSVGVVILLVSGGRLPMRWTTGIFLCLASLSQLLLVRGLSSLACVFIATGVAVRASRWIEDCGSRYWRVLRFRGAPAVAGTGCALGPGDRQRRACPARAIKWTPRRPRRESQRHSDRPGHGPCGSPGALWLSSRDCPQPRAPGRAGSPIRLCPRDRSLDASLACQRVHGPLAA